VNDLIVFDLDGVLIDSKDIHYQALNIALEQIDKNLIISKKEHLSEYDGLSTMKKLEKLTKNKNLDPNMHEKIWKVKQETTMEFFENVEIDKDKVELLKRLKKDGFKLACASNSIKNTLTLLLEKLGLSSYFDFIVSNEDVNNPKPHPEMYWVCMMELNSHPNSTLIIEDSPVGRKGAYYSNAKTLFVENSKEVGLKIYNSIIKQFNIEEGAEKMIYTNKNLNILIPMAGRGSRFADAGYTFPKPLIEVHGKPMIQVVVENLNIDANYIYLVLEEHYEKYNLKTLLNLITPNCKIVIVDKVTEGAASTTLLAKDAINNENPLIISNSDQFIDWDTNETLYNFIGEETDGGIVTFESTHPKWSYAKVGDDGYVNEVAEKNPISDNATVGIYYWKKGSDYVKYAEEMIQKDIRVNNEFYVCPVYNQAIEDNKKIKIHKIDKMWGLGTPEDLNTYLINNPKI
tara:strand:+ start:318 stop:1694 length:1377 start_codon:yes stop_codon:yes gene_type:complete